MTSMLLLLPLGLTACNEYDLKRSDEDPIVDTGEPAPPVDTEVPETETTPSDDAPDIFVDPTYLDFGWVDQECTSAPSEVTITNVGTELLVVDDIDLGGSAAAYYEMVRPQLPLELAPDESAVITLEFAPISSNTLTAEIQVKSNDPDEPNVLVEAIGQGADDSLYEEFFYQDFYSSVDVLWVIDNSGSMSDALNTISDNFSSFIYQFTSLDLDYQMGVVTTDMINVDDQGKLQGDIPYITSSTPNAETVFLAMVNQGATGSADERGFDAVQAALSEPLLSGHNAGFLRGDDVAFATIVVSDENDASSTNSTSFSSWYLGLKSDPALLTFSAFCGDPGSGCFEWVDWSTGAISATSGKKYTDVTATVGGTWQSICSNDFDEALNHLSLNALGMDYQFELTETPSSIAEMVVQVNSLDVEYNSINGWTYDAEANTIVFHDEAIPGPDSTIYVQYPRTSDCE